ncbi:MAG: dehydrogenase [Bacteroidales bacterium]|jgi:D-glycero-alpha-D-manno-heptose-7-phosphate kinase|nr:dehydrogenase [Bacteroidales bacterium]
MTVRSKAPLRLGLAGGGSDVSPFSDTYGGAVLNATIDKYAHCTIEETESGFITMQAADLNLKARYKTAPSLPIDGHFNLHKGVYNRIVKQFDIKKPLSFKIVTSCDVPPGSGLGSSSTMVVAILKAFAEWLNIPLGDYDTACLACEIERGDLRMEGGKQDQYAATFGGFNFIEFYGSDRVIVNPLRIRQWMTDELQASTVLYYTGDTRESDKIIHEQRQNVIENQTNAIEATHIIKKNAFTMKDLLLKGEIIPFCKALGKDWENKKQMATSITNSHIDAIYSSALEAGAYGGKVSGAGGGGFMIFTVDPLKKHKLVNTLKHHGGKVLNFNFSNSGCRSWKPDNIK